MFGRQSVAFFVTSIYSQIQADWLMDKGSWQTETPFHAKWPRYTVTPDPLRPLD